MEQARAGAETSATRCEWAQGADLALALALAPAPALVPYAAISCASPRSELLPLQADPAAV